MRASRSDVTYAFILFYGAMLFGRALYLGEPLAIPLHRLESGALLLFTFFMISDPKTTPDSRAGRVLFAGLVACGAWYVQFRMFRTNGLLWSLAACSLSVPLIDWLFPGDQYTYHENVRKIVGKRTRREFSIGDSVRVLLDRVDSNERKLQFSILEDDTKRSGSHPRRRVSHGSGRRSR